MPYTLGEAKKKSSHYNKIIDAERIEQTEIIDDLLNKASISGSIDANTELRNENGHLVSFEDPDNPGMVDERTFEYVRLQNTQKFFNSNKFKDLKDLKVNGGFSEFIRSNYDEVYKK